MGVITIITPVFQRFNGPDIVDTLYEQPARVVQIAIN